MKNHCRFYTFTIFLSCFLIFILSACKTTPPSAPANQPPTVSIVSPGANEVCSQTDTVFINASDDHGVSKVELYINGTLVGTDNAEPWRFIFDTEQLTDGSYTLQAKAYDTDNLTATSATVPITIENAFPVTFINTIFTPISITVQSVPATIQPGDSVTYTFTTNPGSLVYSAETSGKTSGGAQIGLKLIWGGASYPIDVSSYSYYRLRLIIGSSYFFLYMKNSGTKTLGPLDVNYGLTDQSRDNITISTSTSTYQIGYYKAYTNTQVRAYWYPSLTSYTYWNQGTHFSFPFTTNQYVTLLNLSKTGGGGSIGQGVAILSHGAFQPAQIVASVRAVQIPDDGSAVAAAR